MERTPNERLRAAIERAGWRYDSVARAVRAVAAEAGDPLRTNKSAVAHWIAGRSEPNAKTVGYLTEALSRRLRVPLSPAELGLPAPPGEPDLGLSLAVDPAEALAALGRADMERRSFVTGAVYSSAATALPLALFESAGRASAADSGRTAGTSDIATVWEMTAFFTDIDERRGGSYGRSAVINYFTEDVLPLCRATFRTTTQRKEILLATASLTCLLGWKAFDAGERGLAQRYYLHALRLTKEADSDPHSAFVLRAMVQHAVLLGRPENTLAMADQALSLASGKVDASTMSLFVMIRARALALEGQPRLAIAEAARAAEMAAGAEGEERVPNWSALWSPPAIQVAHGTAQLLIEVGDYASAERLFAQAARAHADERPEARRYGGTELLSQAEIQCRLGRVEEACHTWNLGLDQLSGVRSTRTAEAVRRMRGSLAQYRRRGIAAASHTDERARAWLAAVA